MASSAIFPQLSPSQDLTVGSSSAVVFISNPETQEDGFISYVPYHIYFFLFSATVRSMQLHLWPLVAQLAAGASAGSMGFLVRKKDTFQKPHQNSILILPVSFLWDYPGGGGILPLL